MFPAPPVPVMNSLRRFHRLLSFTGLLLAPLVGQALTVAPVGVPVSGSVRNSMTMVEGRPAIAWSDRNTLQYARALDANGTAWDAPVIVNPGPGLGTYVSLRVVNGMPAVTNFVNVSGLNFFRAADAAGSVWNPPVLIFTGNPPLQATMEIVDGNPAVALRTPAGLVFKRATNPHGTAR